jgi:hypothetical protein
VLVAKLKQLKKSALNKRQTESEGNEMKDIRMDER